MEFKLIKEPNVITESYKDQTIEEYVSLHEVFHFIVAKEFGKDVTSIEITPKGKDRILGSTNIGDEKSYSIQQMKEHIMINLASIAGCELLGLDGCGYSGDLQTAYSLAENIVIDCNVKNYYYRFLCSAKLQEKIETEIIELVMNLYNQSQDIIKKHLGLAVILANELSTKGKLSKKELNKLVDKYWQPDARQP